MSATPTSQLATHTVENQPGSMPTLNLFSSDAPLEAAMAEACARPAAQARLEAFGAMAGAEATMLLGEAANRFPPELVSFDRYGRRLDEVRFHPAYHDLMQLARQHEMPTIAFAPSQAHGHQQHVAMLYMFTQAEAGVCCPMAMTYAAIPTLRRHAPDSAWLLSLMQPVYDARTLPRAAKSGVTMGMAMTEKQGGSDVRSNSTKAVRGADGYMLTGHKWFCSARCRMGF